MKKLKVILYFPPDKTDRPFSYYLVKDYDLVFKSEIEGPAQRIYQVLWVLERL
jgi:hypothetical protein